MGISDGAGRDSHFGTIFGCFGRPFVVVPSVSSAWVHLPRCTHGLRRWAVFFRGFTAVFVAPCLRLVRVVWFDWSFSRPSGTKSGFGLEPALKRRAIIGGPRGTLGSLRTTVGGSSGTLGSRGAGKTSFAGFSRSSHEAQARGLGAAVATGLREFAADAGCVVVTGARERFRERWQIFVVEVVEASRQSDVVVHPAIEHWFGSFLADRRCVGFHHGDVDVFENLARCDAENALAGFDEIVSLAAAVRAAESVAEAEGGVELLGFDQEACAVCLPLDRFHDADPRAAKLRDFFGTNRELAGAAGYFY